ncbi:MAG: glycoside hydrolase family 28 protein [Clostridia bacterium]|nr:glycoside hydrolase family 28 protein [Clostridia bacterium]
MERNDLRQAILAKITWPTIPDRVLLATAHGIHPDTGEDLTLSLQQAIDTLSLAGGGRLILPSGIYRTGALQLKDGIELHLESPDTVLQFIPEATTSLYPLVLSHWEASPCYNFSPLLYACDAHDIAVTGCGTIDGGADATHWWNWHHQVEESWSSNKVDLQFSDRGALRQMNLNGIPVEERRFGEGHYLRPNFIQFLRCTRVLLSDFTLHHSPMWQINPVQCKSVIVDHLTISSHGSNNDGCDPESCDGVLIRNCLFDTGDDCIALKSGRDRDGRMANIPCENILIEHNTFADGHGGIALGSEMSGGIRNVLAENNHFTSPNLTYALRFKTNAKRGGFIESVMLCDSTIEHVGAAAVHGTMLYEDGPNGDSLPVFRDITIDTLTAHGGDYGIFLEAFPQVPITGLTLSHIHIDHVQREIRSMSWQDPVIEDVVINGKSFPRPVSVRITGVPVPGKPVHALATSCGESGPLTFEWEIRSPEDEWQPAGKDSSLTVPACAFLRVHVLDAAGNRETSRTYRVLSQATEEITDRLLCRNIPVDALPASGPYDRLTLCRLLLPFADPSLPCPPLADTDEITARKAVANGFFAADHEGRFHPHQVVTREEMATVCMQLCGINYHNASSTMPLCLDVSEVAVNYGTNVARALYFGFMSLTDGYFFPRRPVSRSEILISLNQVADFAGL